MTTHAGKPAYRISVGERQRLHGSIAAACRAARAYAGMSRQQVAAAGGPSAALLARIETEQYFGSLVTYYLLAKATDVSFASLIGAAVDGVAREERMRDGGE